MCALEPEFARLAVVMPVFNEDPSRIFEGLRVIYRSLEQTGRLDEFDFRLRMAARS